MSNASLDTSVFEKTSEASDIMEKVLVLNNPLFHLVKKLVKPLLKCFILNVRLRTFSLLVVDPQVVCLKLTHPLIYKVSIAIM